MKAYDANVAEILQQLEFQMMFSSHFQVSRIVVFTIGDPLDLCSCSTSRGREDPQQRSCSPLVDCSTSTCGSLSRQLRVDVGERRGSFSHRHLTSAG